MVHNKKGDVNFFVITFILAAIILVLSIVWGNKVFSSSNEMLSCSSQGGVCAGKCNFPTQIPIGSGKTAKCEKSQLCCQNITRTKPIDPMCMNSEGTEPLRFGTECDDHKYCDMAQVCVGMCEFCSTNLNNKQYAQDVEKICGSKLNADNRKKFSKGYVFSCGCTKEECDADKEKCVYGFCPADVADTTNPEYACCAE